MMQWNIKIKINTSANYYPFILNLEQANETKN